IYPQKLVYYLVGWGVSVAFLLVYVAYHLEETKDLLTSRSLKYGATSTLSVLLVLGILIFIGLVTVKHSAQWDLTQNKMFTLSPQTVTVLEGLESPVTVTAFFPK